MDKAGCEADSFSDRSAPEMLSRSLLMLPAFVRDLGRDSSSVADALEDLGDWSCVFSAVV